MEKGEPPSSGSPLPAPYRSPWSGLAEALKAVLADLRLTLRRLWRRNRQGELPLPQAWPLNLAPLFWPLLLGAALALLLALGSWLIHAAAAPRPGAPEAGGDAAALAPTALPPEGGVAGVPTQSAGVIPERAGAEAAATSAANAARPQPGAGRAEGDGAGGIRGTAGDTAAAATPELRLDPLLELLGQGEDGGLLLAARPDPADARLTLTLSDSAEALPQAALLEQALQWQQRAREAGYERLELRDRQGRLRGRDALVGSGMILLAPVPGS